MDSSFLYLLAADAILLLHVLITLFIVFGLIFIFIGKSLSWVWIYNPWFRLTHILAIGIVAIISFTWPFWIFYCSLLILVAALIVIYSWKWPLE